jgi:hypothetical protein
MLGMNECYIYLVLSAQDVFMVTALDLYFCMFCDVNGASELMLVNISVSQLGYRHLRPVTPPSSILGET